MTAPGDEDDFESDDDIFQFLEENEELFRDLAECIICPSCKQKVRKPFYDLGPAYHHFEGCKACSEKGP